MLDCVDGFADDTDTTVGVETMLLGELTEVDERTLSTKDGEDLVDGVEDGTGGPGRSFNPVVVD